MENANKILSQTSVLKLYHQVIDDVITNIREDFLDDGVDEQVLQELKQIWTNKLLASKAIEIAEPQPQNVPPVLQNSSKANTGKIKKNAMLNNEAKLAASAGSSINGNKNAIQSNFIQSNHATSSSNAALTKQQQLNSSFQEIKSEPNPQQNVIQQQSQPPQSTQPTQQQTQQITTTQKLLDPNKLIPIQITLPPLSGSTNTKPPVLTIQVPASAIQENQLQQVLTGNIITSILPLSPDVASSVLQQHVNSVLSSMNAARNNANIGTNRQLDGAATDSSDEDASDLSEDNIDGEDDDDDLENEDEENDADGRPDEEPLNSEDDVTDEDAADLFDTDNVVVCQYDKITRSRNKWKFYLKDGIMNIGGKDYVFQKSNGDAEW